MTTNNDELQRWVGKLQRKLDSTPLTKGDREDLEELVAIVVNTALKQMVQPISPGEPVRKSKNGGAQ